MGGFPPMGGMMGMNPMMMGMMGGGNPFGGPKPPASSASGDNKYAEQV